MSEIRDRVIQQVEEIVAEILRDVSGVDALRYYADKILQIPALAIVDRGAELPHNPHSATFQYDRHYDYMCAQQDMKGWVKEILEVRDGS